MRVAEFSLPIINSPRSIFDLVPVEASGSPAACSCQSHGMGLLDNMSPWVKYAIIGGGVLLLGSMLVRPGKAKYNRELSDARDEYQSRVRSIRRKYPRLGSRVSALPF